MSPNDATPLGESAYTCYKCPMCQEVYAANAVTTHECTPSRLALQWRRGDAVDRLKRLGDRLSDAAGLVREAISCLTETPTGQWPKKPGDTLRMGDLDTACPACGRSGDHAENCTPIARSVARNFLRGERHAYRDDEIYPSDFVVKKQREQIAQLERRLAAAEKGCQVAVSRFGWIALVSTEETVRALCQEAVMEMGS